MFYFEDTTTQQDLDDGDDCLVFLDQENAREGLHQPEEQSEVEKSPDTLLQRIRSMM